MADWTAQVPLDEALKYLADLVARPAIKQPSASAPLFACHDYGLIVCGHAEWGHYWYRLTSAGEATLAAKLEA